MKKTIAAAAMIAALVSCGPKATDLFNGKDLTGWEFVLADDTPAADVFKAEDGEIHIAGQPFGYMYYSVEKFSDFVYEAEWAWPEEPANSGLFFLIAETSNPFPNGIECQLKAGNAGDMIMLGGSRLEEYVAPEEDPSPRFPLMQKLEESSEKPAGEWNSGRIEVVDGHIKVYINGVLQNEGTNPCKEGYVALQSEGGPVKFRNVKVTRL